MINRILGVFRLNSQTFEEIEHDPAATTQAAIIVAIVAVLNGIGSGTGTAIAGGNFFASFFTTLLWAFIGWFVWAGVTYFVGTTLLGGRATISEMLRVIGYAQAPLFLSIIPCVGFVIGGIWALIAGFIAIRQGLDLDNTKAFLTIIVGFVVYFIGSLFVNAVVGGASYLMSNF